MMHESLKLSLDASTSSLASGRRQLRDIDIDGVLHYIEGHGSRPQLAEDLERVWNIYPGGLLDLKEEELEILPGNQLAVNPEPGEEAPQSVDKDRYEMITAEAMELLRSDVFVQLNDARNELWYVLELAKTLAGSSSFTITPPEGVAAFVAKKGVKGKPKAEDANLKSKMGQQVTIEQPPILPPATFSATFSTSPDTHEQTVVRDLEIALAAQQEAVENCSRLIDTAVAELQTMTDAGDGFWRDVRSLKEGDRTRGQWAILPRPDFGRSMKEGDNARDIIIPYALDEASPALRARCLAAFDLDPNKEGSLTFGARTHLNLRVKLNTGTETASSTLESCSTDESDVRQIMEIAQLESFDEELFDTLRHEISALDGTITAQNSLIIPTGDGELEFELYDSRSGPSSLMSTSATCDLVLYAARLLFLKVHQYRKRRLISRQASIVSGPRTIVRSVLSAVNHHSTCNKVLSTLSIFKSIAQQAGINSTIVAGYSGITNPGDDVVRLLQTANSDLDLGRAISLEVEGCRGITIKLSAASQIRLTTSRASFAVADISELPAIIASDMGDQILAFAADQLRDLITDETKLEEVFLNDLEAAITLSRRGIIRVFIPAPYDAVCADFLSTGDSPAVESYDSRKRQELKLWLREVSNTVFSDVMAE